MQNILLVIDMQNDFIDGALGTKEAVAIVPAVKAKIENFDGTVLFTRDTASAGQMAGRSVRSSMPCGRQRQSTSPHLAQRSSEPF